MKITYDPQVDAMYIRFVDDFAQVITQRVSEDIALNYGSDGKVIGIEILDASEYVFKGGGAHQIELRNLQATPV